MRKDQNKNNNNLELENETKGMCWERKLVLRLLSDTQLIDSIELVGLVFSLISPHTQFFFDREIIIF